MENGQKLKLGYAHVTPRNIQEVQVSKLGDAPEAPPSSSAKIRSPSVLLSVFLFALLAATNVGSHHVVLEGDILRFSLPRTL
jgi:hypothetical protein